MKRIVFAGALLAASLAASAPVLAQGGGPALPAGEGRDLLTAACTSCHGLATITAMRDGAAGWKALVYNMVLRGAQLNGAETDKLIDYLAANYGPNSPRPANVQVTPVALAAGAGKEPTEAHCSLCHDLVRVVAVKRTKAEWDTIVANMATRGALLSPDDAKTISAYLAAQYGRN